MKKMFLLLVVLVLTNSINAQLPSYFNLATDNGVFLKGEDAKVKNKMETISFHLIENHTYSLKFAGESDVEFVCEGVTFTGYINKIDIETGDKPQVLILFVKGKGKFSYALGMN